MRGMPLKIKLSVESHFLLALKFRLILVFARETMGARCVGRRVPALPSDESLQSNKQQRGREREGSKGWRYRNDLFIRTVRALDVRYQLDDEVREYLAFWVSTILSSWQKKSSCVPSSPPRIFLFRSVSCSVPVSNHFSLPLQAPTCHSPPVHQMPLDIPNNPGLLRM